MLILCKDCFFAFDWNSINEWYEAQFLHCQMSLIVSTDNYASVGSHPFNKVLYTAACLCLHPILKWKHSRVICRLSNTWRRYTFPMWISLNQRGLFFSNTCTSCWHHCTFWLLCMYGVGFDDGARMVLRCSGANNSGSGTLSSEFVVMYFDRPTARQRWPFLWNGAFLES